MSLDLYFCRKCKKKLARNYISNICLASVSSEPHGMYPFQTKFQTLSFWGNQIEVRKQIIFLILDKNYVCLFSVRDNLNTQICYKQCYQDVVLVISLPKAVTYKTYHNCHHLELLIDRQLNKISEIVDGVDSEVVVLCCTKKNFYNILNEYKI